MAKGKQNESIVHTLIKYVYRDTLKRNPKNPRVIRDEAFKQLVESIRAFPEMLEIRPIVCADGMIIGGDKRFEASKAAGLKFIPVIDASFLNEDQRKQFIVRDNHSSGEWDFLLLLEQYDNDFLTGVGINIPDVSADDFKEQPPSEKVTTVVVEMPNADTAAALAEELTLRGLVVKVKK